MKKITYVIVFLLLVSMASALDWSIMNDWVPISGGTFTGDVIATYFNGSFNWTTTDDWSSFDGNIFDFNESKLSTIYYNATQVDNNLTNYILTSEEGNLNVNNSNSSDYWDSLDSPSDISVADLGDTSATGTELNSLTDNSMADTLHRHSELSASDGTPDQALKVDASGNVGIGTTTPQNLLTLSNPTADYSEAGIDFFSTLIPADTVFNSGRIYGKFDGGGYAAGRVTIATPTALNTFVDTLTAKDGKVGIGTTAPDGKLHVLKTSAGTVTANANADELVVEGGSEQVGINIIAPNASDSNIYFGSPADTSGAIISWNYDDKLFDIGTATASGEVQFKSGNYVDAMRIDKDGDVGIGTDNPGEKLQIGSGTDTSNNYIEIQTDNSGSYTPGIKFGWSDLDYARIEFPFDTRSTAGLKVGTFNAYPLSLYANSIKAVTIVNTNVGIGVAAPASGLELGSTRDLHITDGSLCVENAGGTDCAGSVDGVVYADDFIEHSRSLPEKGLPTIMNMKNKPDGTLDHKSFPSYVSKEVSWNDTYENGTLIKEAGSKLNEGVSLSSQIKYLIKGVQELKAENDLLKSEVCAKDSNYTFCNVAIKQTTPSILYDCEATQTTKECPFEISGGIGTRCYKTIEHDSWWYCSGGWKLK